MSNQVKVEKICITIGKKTLELTPAELKELRDVLDSAFPKENHVTYPTYVFPPSKPWIHTPNWKYWDVDFKRQGTLCLSVKDRPKLECTN